LLDSCPTPGCLRSTIGPLRIAIGACLLSLAAAAAEPESGLARAVDEVARGARAADELQIRVEWTRDGELVPARIYGRGVGIWRGRTQVVLDRATVSSLAAAVSRSGFASMPETIGEEKTDLLKLRGKVTVRVAGAQKTVVQLVDGPQSRELASLAEEAMAACESAARGGVTAGSLTDALTKLGSGALAPEALEVVAQHRPETPRSEEPGFLLRLTGREAEARPFRARTGYGVSKRLVISESELRRIVTAMREADLEGLPQSLYAPDYVELRVQILDRTKDVTARRALAVSKEAGGAHQRSFERLDAELVRLAKVVLRK
jgi:hypothetical protein